MEDKIFKVKDETRRKIHLSKERWNDHIRPEHPDIEEPYEIEQTILNPDKIIEQGELIYCYYKYFKHKKSKLKYLKVIVNYLNNHGYIVTAHYVASIKTR